eukprot:5377061-Pyramimonas_sp.AAC.1
MAPIRIDSQAGAGTELNRASEDVTYGVNQNKIKQGSLQLKQCHFSQVRTGRPPAVFSHEQSRSDLE